MSTHREVINSLLPDGKFWEVKPESDLDKLYDGSATNWDRVLSDIEKSARIRDPYNTPALDDLEREYGLVPITGSTETERRTRLAAFIFRRNSTGAHDVLQQKLRDAGFDDVYVHINSPAVDPSQFLERAETMMCGDLLPSGHEAQCGEPEAVCASDLGFELVVNGDWKNSRPIYTIQCNDGMSCGDGSCAGQFSGYRSSSDLNNFTIPNNPGYWPLIFFIGGVATRDIDGKITAIKFYPVPNERRLDFRRIILKFKALSSWGVSIVDYH